MEEDKVGEEFYAIKVSTKGSFSLSDGVESVPILSLPAFMSYII